MKAVLALSGGMDSATVLAYMVEDHRTVIPVSFSYGSKHNKWEAEAARKVLAHYMGEPPRLNHIDLSEVFIGFKSDLLQSGGDIPEGHYEAESMSRTVVPGRNIIFASILSGLAWSGGAGEVWLGIHAGDHAIYPDCRPEFFNYMQLAVHHGTDGKVDLVAPFLRVDKAAILEQGLRLNVPYHLTRTCYKDQPVACGKCGSCQERLTAFKRLGVEDPIEYESRELMPK